MFIYNKSMEALLSLGTIVKKKRLSLNKRMDDVANEANITRATLWSIEKGNSNYSIESLMRVLSVLDLSLDVSGGVAKSNRHRAKRINTRLDKKINRFIIMCVEQYADSANKSSRQVYQEMKQKGVIDELVNDYEDLHGMSFTYLNDYIDALLQGD